MPYYGNHSILTDLLPPPRGGKPRNKAKAKAQRKARKRNR